MYYLRYNANFTNRLTWQVITKVEMDNTGLKVVKKFSLTGHCKVEFQFFSHFSEIDYVCFDMLPRHHSIIRWRMGK